MAGNPYAFPIIPPSPKACAHCKVIKPPDEFSVDRWRPNHMSSWCKDCTRDRMRSYKGDPESRRKNAKASSRKYPLRRRAREDVKHAIRRGDIPRAATLACVDCGRPAKQYDHHEGYNHPLSVQPVCNECHGKRSRKRGEHKRVIMENPQ